MHVDRAAAVGEGVLEQGREHLREGDGGRPHEEAALAPDPHRPPGLLEGRLPLALQGGDDGVERDGRRGAAGAAGAPEQVVDDAGEPLDLGDGDGGLLLDDRGVVGVARSPRGA